MAVIDFVLGLLKVVTIVYDIGKNKIDFFSWNHGLEKFEHFALVPDRLLVQLIN